LRHYEDLKKSIDQDIIQQKLNYQKLIDEVHQKLRQEEQKYEELVKTIDKETKRIEEEQDVLQGFEKKEESLKRRLQALQELVSSIEKQADREREVVKSEEEALAKLKLLAKKIQEDIIYKREKEIEPLIALSEEHENKILEIQEDLIEKIKKKKAEIEGYSHQASVVSQRFYQFFKKEMEIGKALEDLERRKQEMRAELEALRKKAEAFSAIAKSSDAKKFIAELEQKTGEFDKKKKAFQESIDKLKAMLVPKTP
ncbi:hypothetical protein D6783_00005, partial [Candidatus Woesearchaeota archaeon]